MGRYDKIQVRNNGTWITPSRIELLNNGQWISLGTQNDNDTSNQKTIEVYDNNQWKRVNKTYVAHVGDTYTTNQFTVSANGSTSFDYRPSGNAGKTWKFKATRVRRTNYDSGNICYIDGGSKHAQVFFNANGTVSFNATWSGGGVTITTTYAVPVNTWVEIEAYSPANVGGRNAPMYLYIRDVNGNQLGSAYISSNQGQEFNYSNDTNKIGNYNVQFKQDSTIYLQGVRYENIENIWNHTVTTGNIPDAGMRSDTYYAWE